MAGQFSCDVIGYETQVTQINCNIFQQAQACTFKDLCGFTPVMNVQRQKCIPWDSERIEIQILSCNTCILNIK